MKPIYFLSLDKQLQKIKGEVFDAFDRVYRDSAFSGGKYVDQFEQEFAGFCKSPYCVAVDSGTAALHLALLALDIGKGDEVIVPANTFIASAAAVNHAGAKPVFVDCDPKTWNIDHNDVKKKITKKTKAIIGVHLYGQPFNITKIKEISKEYHLKLIEDCAQAHGATYNDVKVGNFGDIACFSFYPGKNLGALGEAGAVITANKKYYDRLLKLRNHGSLLKYYHDEIGFNYRMDGVQAAILSVKLKYLEKWNKKRQKICRIYDQEIINPKISKQNKEYGAESVYHLYVITTQDRATLQQHLNKANIFPGLHYPVPCHLQKAYKDLSYKKGDFPNAEYLAEHCLSLPVYPEMTLNEVKRVVKQINIY